jgi:rod shape-determining protein MreD
MGQETRVLFVWYTVAVLGAFFLAYVIATIDAGRAPSLLALLGQIVPTLLIFPLADRLIQRFDDGDVRFR